MAEHGKVFCDGGDAGKGECRAGVAIECNGHEAGGNDIAEAGKFIGLPGENAHLRRRDGEIGGEVAVFAGRVIVGGDGVGGDVVNELESGEVGPKQAADLFHGHFRRLRGDLLGEDVLPAGFKVGHLARDGKGNIKGGEEMVGRLGAGADDG